MTEPIIHPSEVNRVWSDTLKTIRHAQVNDLQLIRSYLKLEKWDRLDRCAALMLERLEQERILQSFGDPVWQMRFLPFLYGVEGIRFQFMAPSYSADHPQRMLCFEEAWRLSGLMEVALLRIARLCASKGWGQNQQDPEKVKVMIRFDESGSELIYGPADRLPKEAHEWAGDQLPYATGGAGDKPVVTLQEDTNCAVLFWKIGEEHDVC